MLPRSFRAPSETLSTLRSLSGMIVANGLAILIIFCLLLSVWQKPPAIGE
jgi:hypothetical protein